VGVTGEIEGWDQFVHIPDLSSEQAREDAAAVVARRERERLRERGVLLFEERAAPTASPMMVGRPLWCADREGPGFLVCWAAPGIAGTIPVGRHAPPWAGSPAPTGWTAPPGLMALRVSPSGRFLVAAHARGVRIWDLEQ